MEVNSEKPEVDVDASTSGGTRRVVGVVRGQPDFVDDEDHHMCRVCRGHEGSLYYPCLCTGSIKYVHQECLTEWLKYSKKEVCELCNYKYSFQPIYRSDMPKVLPILEVFKGIGISVVRIIRTWLMYTMVLFAWLGVVPLTAARFYNTVFYMSVTDLLNIPHVIFKTDGIYADLIKGTFFLAIYICTFISLVWLREQIIHGGPQDFINIPEPVVEVVVPPPQEGDNDAADAPEEEEPVAEHDDERLLPSSSLQGDNQQHGDEHASNEQPSNSGSSADKPSSSSDKPSSSADKPSSSADNVASTSGASGEPSGAAGEQADLDYHAIYFPGRPRNNSLSYFRIEQAGDPDEGVESPPMEDLIYDEEQYYPETHRQDYLDEVARIEQLRIDQGYERRRQEQLAAEAAARAMIDESDEEEEDESDDGIIHVPRALPRRRRRAENEEGDGQQANDAGAQPQEENWRDWDRLGDELTWQRLLGLDGTFMFLEHVLWVISLNTIFTILFALIPYKLGFALLTRVGIQQQLVYFPSLAAILCGYVAIALIVYVVHAAAGVMRMRGLYRLLGITFLVLKVFLLVLLEIGFFPVVCGCWMDLCSLSIFSASLSTRIATFASQPFSSVFIHWMIGMVYVFYSASFVLLLREVLRPGVLWFMRNLNDPEFNPIQEMIELPVSRHLRRLVASTSLFFTAIFLIVYLPLRITQRLAPGVLPFNLSLSAETPLSELSVELLILQIVLPALLEQTQARTLLKSFVGIWCSVVGKTLNLERYLLPDEPVEPAAEGDVGGGGAGGANAAAAAEVAAAGGGLAAEHQALLLMREPRAFQPYERPTFFVLRILALIALMGATATCIAVLVYVVPVSFGRFIVLKTTGHKNVHELYTVGFGLYVCWMTIRLVIFISDTARRGIPHFRESAIKALSIAARFTLVALPIVVLLPLFIGSYFQLVMITPLRVTSQQSALYFPWQDWAMGVLHLKIVCAMIMMGPDWQIKRVCEQIYADGFTRLRATFIYTQLIVPSTLFLSSLLAAPYVIARFYIYAAGLTREQGVLAIRYSFPCSLFVILLYAFITWQLTKIKSLVENIRNEKYLVGTQLVNYERISQEQQQSQPQEKEGAGEALPAEIEVNAPANDVVVARVLEQLPPLEAVDDN